ncbi:hypothetical protein [Streptomyces sp. ODS05-4]|uniref:hypothetical protein n=1 Tax=Streptomyces sp. ODS05-4 TaxID=2944939 RepID=UPI00210C804B|nr:hypothetical protein [Streptomyces sp. ODS05-4]
MSTGEGRADQGGGTGHGWAAAVRGALAPGLLLPLGGPDDGVWITERAAAGVLGGAMQRAAPDAVPGRVRVRSAAGGAAAAASGTPAPPGALPAGPLRVEAEFAALAGSVLPEVADRLRTAVLAAAEELLGLRVTAVDLRVTALLDALPERPPGEDGPPAADTPPDGAPEPGSPEAVAAAVPGVARLTGALGRPVHRTAGRLRVELATAPGRRARDVATAARAALAADDPHTAVTVVVTETG